MRGHTFTERQRVILSFIRKFIEARGYPPTRAEICQGFKFASNNAAEQHLRTLQAKGALKLIPGISRGIVLVQGTSTPISGHS